MTSDQAMRSLADEATQGPWRVWYSPDPTKLRDTAVETAWCHGDIEGDTELITDYLPTDVDAEFIAACREWVPEVLERLERVRALHQPESDPLDPTTMLCRHCSWDSDVKHPCPTIQALDEKGTRS